MDFEQWNEVADCSAIWLVAWRKWWLEVRERIDCGGEGRNTNQSHKSRASKVGALVARALKFEMAEWVKYDFLMIGNNYETAIQVFKSFPSSDQYLSFQMYGYRCLSLRKLAGFLRPLLSLSCLRLANSQLISKDFSFFDWHAALVSRCTINSFVMHTGHLI